MKVSTVLIFATSIIGAAAQYDYSGFDLEQRGLNLEQREIDLERREIKFKRMARAWLAARDAQDGLSPRSSPCAAPCPPRTYCDDIQKICLPVAGPPPPPPPSPQSGNNRAPNKKPMAAKKGGSKKGGSKKGGRK